MTAVTAGTGPQDAYDRRIGSASYRRERAEKARVILALCGEGIRTAERVADLGAGTGLVKKTLEIETDSYIYGFEIDTSFVEWKRGMVAADVLDLPVGTEALDFLILNHLYEHVDDQAGLFREAWRVLRPGGRAYVSAGNVLAVMEPHYRLPFLSWLPRPAADAYLRLTGRGRAYEGIRFRSRRALVEMMRGAGFGVRDLTERVLEDLLGPERGRARFVAWRVLRRLPAAPRRALLRVASPQWFFLLEKGAAAACGSEGGGEGGSSGGVEREGGMGAREAEA